MSGGLAEAEALGRFAQLGVRSAFYWTLPADHSPAFFAFVAYRSFDGKGGHFLDYSLPTTASSQTSLFASRDDSGKHVVAIALNLAPDSAAQARIDIPSCGHIASREVYSYTGAATGFASVKDAPPTDGSLNEVLAPYSITVFDIQLADAMPGTLEK
jgi:hypothetical protein